MCLDQVCRRSSGSPLACGVKIGAAPPERKPAQEVKVNGSLAMLGACGSRRGVAPDCVSARSSVRRGQGGACRVCSDPPRSCSSGGGYFAVGVSGHVAAAHQRSGPDFSAGVRCGPVNTS